MAFSPRLGLAPGVGEWRMVYRYMHQAMFHDALARGVHPVNGKIWITPQFFRFQAEARAFLALPNTNGAETSVYVDLGHEIGKLPWRPSPATSFAPGGALEHDYPAAQPIPRVQVIESFDLVAGSSVVGAGRPPQWAFPFTER